MAYASHAVTWPLLICSDSLYANCDGVQTGALVHLWIWLLSVIEAVYCSSFNTFI